MINRANTKVNAENILLKKIALKTAITPVNAYFFEKTAAASVNNAPESASDFCVKNSQGDANK